MIYGGMYLLKSYWSGSVITFILIYISNDQVWNDFESICSILKNLFIDEQHTNILYIFNEFQDLRYFHIQTHKHFIYTKLCLFCWRQKSNKSVIETYNEKHNRIIFLKILRFGICSQTHEHKYCAFLCRQISYDLI